MLGLPKSTELNKQLPKKAIYAKFQLNTTIKGKVDSDISRITIVNEVSPTRVNLAAGENVKAFFAINVSLKQKEFSESTVALISKLIPQNILMILDYGDEAKLAVYRSKLIQTEWQPKESLSVRLEGLDLDAVWNNIIVQVGGIQMEEGKTLDEQIALDEKRTKIQTEINRLDKLARGENQPKKKFDLVQRIKKLQQELEDI